MPRPKPPGPDVARPKGKKYCLTKRFNSLQSLVDQVLIKLYCMYFKSIIFLNKFLEMNMPDLLRFFLLQSYLTKIPDYVLHSLSSLIVT